MAFPTGRVRTASSSSAVQSRWPFGTRVPRHLWVALILASVSGVRLVFVFASINFLITFQGRGFPFLAAAIFARRTGSPFFGAVAVLDRDHAEELLQKLPVTEIAGIASRRARKLESYGIKTCLEFAQANGRNIKGLLTVVGHDLWSELNGVPVHAIRPQRTPHKMISRGGSLAGRVSDPDTLYGWLIRNVDRLIEELQYHEVRARELTVYLSCTNADSLGASVPFGTPTDRFDLLAGAAKIGRRWAWRPGACCTHLHLIASKLVRGTKWQGNLFELPNLEFGVLQNARAEDAVRPAHLGFHRGTWFLIVEGIECVVIRDRDLRPVVYMITEPSTNYYRNRTEQEPMMPALVGQVL